MNGFWERCLAKLQQSMPAQQFSTWIKPLRIKTVANGDAADHVWLLAPNGFVLKWVKERYMPLIEEEFRLCCPSSASLNLGVYSSVEGPAKTAHLTQSIDGSQAAAVSELASNDDAAVEPVSSAALLADDDGPSDSASRLNSAVYDKSRLIAGFTFDNLVVGKANDLARAAAMQIANNPGRAYNPLFVYGGAGLGKTHLLHAIGNAILAVDPSKVVCYAHAEDYYTDVVRAYQQKAFDALKRNYRNLDVLLIDDVQFFNGKGRTQEEFFFVFNALVDAKKQIVITCDTYPKDINGLDHRLVTRFDWGLTVQIEAPEFEMRVAILQKKAEAERIAIDKEVAFLIAKHLRSNVRELEGALNKVIAYANFYGQPISMQLANEALKDIIRPARNIGIEDIQKTVADYYKIKMADMFSKKRTRVIVRPRQVAMWLCKEVTSQSFPAIGSAFGGRDHTTVIHAVRTIDEERQIDTRLNHDLHVLVQTLRGP